MKKKTTTKAAKKQSKNIVYEPDKVMLMVAIIAVLSIVLLAALGLSGDSMVSR